VDQSCRSWTGVRNEAFRTHHVIRTFLMIKIGNTETKSTMQQRKVGDHKIRNAQTAVYWLVTSGNLQIHYQNICSHTMQLSPLSRPSSSFTFLPPSSCTIRDSAQIVPLKLQITTSQFTYAKSTRAATSFRNHRPTYCSPQYSISVPGATPNFVPVPSQSPRLLSLPSPMPLPLLLPSTSLSSILLPVPQTYCPANLPVYQPLCASIIPRRWLTVLR
jgi:hypothetical protein